MKKVIFGKSLMVVHKKNKRKQIDILKLAGFNVCQQNMQKGKLKLPNPCRMYFGKQIYILKLSCYNVSP